MLIPENIPLRVPRCCCYIPVGEHHPTCFLADSVEVMSDTPFFPPSLPFAPKSADQGRYEPQKLSERHMAYLRLYSTGQYTQKEIAGVFGVTEVTIGNIVNSQLGQEYLAMLRHLNEADVLDVHKRLVQAAPLALARKLEILLDDDTDPKLMDKVSSDILDRAGHGAVRKNVHAVARLDASELEEVKRAGAAANIEFVDVEIVEEFPSEAEGDG